MHLKRQEIAKEWPIKRKGTKFLAVPRHNKNALPLVVVLRDLLEIVKNSKEAKRIIHEKKVKINGKIISEIRYPLSLFDILNIENKNYRLEFSASRKYILNTIEKEAEKKICKIIGKKILPKNKIQLNLNDGRNIISEKNAKTGDSIVVNLKNNSGEKIINLKEGAKVYVIEGKHIGKTGKIKKIDKSGGKEIAELDSKIRVWTKNLLAIE